MKSNNLIAGCVVLYNPGDEVFSNISSYINQVDVLFVIDNSAFTEEDFREKIVSFSVKIRYLPQYRNRGIAAALNIAARLAMEDGYFWLLTMDQDSYFLNHDFFADFRKENFNESIGLIAASYTDDWTQWQKKYSLKFNEIHYVLTSGNILNLAAWKKTGGFEEKLFIDEVDHDYCLKLRQFDYKILVTTTIYLSHSIGKLNNSNSSLFSGNKIIILHEPIRYYYFSRNGLFLCKKYFWVDFKFSASRFKYLLRLFARIIVYFPDKKTYLQYFFAGIKDFLFSKYYNYQN